MEEKVHADHDRTWDWIDWYRFARGTVGLEHVEAVGYANARYLEDQNRARLRDRHAA